MPKRYLFAAQFRYTLTPTLIHTKCIAIQPSVMGYIANSVSLVKRKARNISSVRHCVSTLSFYSRWFSPDQGMYSVHWDLLAPQLSTLHRLSSYVWPEIMTTRYRALNDLVASLHLESIFYVVQAREQNATTRRISLLTFPASTYASPRKLARGERQLRGCNTIVRVCTRASLQFILGRGLDEGIKHFPSCEMLRDHQN